MNSVHQTNAELIDFKFKVMGEDIAATRDEIRSLSKKMDAFIESANKSYATKEETEKNTKAIESLREEQRSVVLKIFFGMGTALVAGIVYVTQAVLKKIGFFN